MTVFSSFYVLRLVKMSVLLALHSLTVFYVVNNSLKSHIFMLFHFLNRIVECAFILLYNQLAIIDLAQWLSFFISIQCFIYSGRKLILYFLFTDSLFSEFWCLSMINININININIIIIMNQFTVSSLFYNVKISVCESLLCFYFDSETVVLIVKSLYIFSFSEILSCAVSFLEILSLSCFISCCLVYNTVSLLSVTLSAYFSDWQCFIIILEILLTAVILFIVMWSSSESWELLWI